MVNLSLTVTSARYAKSKMAVRIPPTGTGFMAREHRLANRLGRWSGRERAFICSPAAVRKLEALIASGTADVNFYGEIVHE